MLVLILLVSLATFFIVLKIALGLRDAQAKIEASPITKLVRSFAG